MLRFLKKYRVLFIFTVVIAIVLFHFYSLSFCSDVVKSKVRPAERQALKLPVETSGGFMVAFRFYEQQTQGLRNLLQFQCVANSYGLRVLEPFVTNSMFTVPFLDFLQHNPKEYLKLGDLIDMPLLHKNTSALYPPISSWESFLETAPRNLILNCIRYRNPPEIHVPKPGFNFRYGCTPKCYKKFNATLAFLSKYGFKLVRKSCSNFVDYSGSVSVDEFGENIFGSHNSANVTVVINEFRGLFGLYRLPLRSMCGIDNKVPKTAVFPSARIMTDTDKYSQHVFQGHRYIGIVARVERIILHLNYKIEQCVTEVNAILKQLKIEKRLSSSFLALDVGQFGSRGANQANLLPKGMALFDAVYEGKNWTFEKWENTFSSIASSSNAAYVANLQRTVAAKADCLIMVGGGGFQGQTRNLYEIFHPQISHQCVYKVCHKEQDS